MNGDTYDAYWTNGSHIRDEFSKEYFEKAFGVLKGRKVLDYGCGFGCGYQRQLNAIAQDYVGADISAEAVRNAEGKGLKALRIDEGGKVAIPSGSRTGVVCSEVFEHLWDPLAAAKELHRVLEPGGILVASVPNFGYFPWRFNAFLRARVPLEPDAEDNRFRGVHIRFFSLLMFRRLLLDAGFKEVKIYGWAGSSIWDFFWCLGPLAKISNWSHKHIPAPLHFGFLGRLWPNVFAERLRAVAIK